MKPVLRKSEKSISGRCRTYLMIIGMCVLFSCMTQVSLAQPNVVEDDGTEDFSDPDAPVDGGIALLIAAGIGYGVKKYRDQHKRSSVEL